MEESHGWTADVEPECKGAASPSGAAPAASAPSPSYNKHPLSCPQPHKLIKPNLLIFFVSQNINNPN